MLKKQPKFNTRADMLEVIHTMYRYILDNPSTDYQFNQTLPKRLDNKQQKELGKKLALYWDVKK